MQLLAASYALQSYTTQVSSNLGFSLLENLSAASVATEGLFNIAGLLLP